MPEDLAVPAEELVDARLAAAAEAASQGNVQPGRDLLGLQASTPPDQDVTAALLSLMSALQLHADHKYGEAAAAFESAAPVVGAGSNVLVQLSMRLAWSFDQAQLAMDRGDRYQARVVLDEAISAATPALNALPQLVPIVLEMTALTAQFRMGEALTRGDFANAELALREAIDSRRRAAGLPAWSPADRADRDLGVPHFEVLLSSLMAFQGLENDDIREAEKAVAATSDDAARLQELISNGGLPSEEAAEMKATLEFRRSVAGLLALAMSAAGVAAQFSADRVPKLSAAELGESLLSLYELGAAAGPAGDVFVSASRELDQFRDRLARRVAPAGSGRVSADRMSGSQTLLAVGMIAVLFVIMAAVIGGTPLGDNGVLTLIVVVLLGMPIVALASLAILGYERTKEAIPSIFVPLIDAGAKLVRLAPGANTANDSSSGSASTGSSSAAQPSAPGSPSSGSTAPAPSSGTSAPQPAPGPTPSSAGPAPSGGNQAPSAEGPAPPDASAAPGKDPAEAPGGG